MARAHNTQRECRTALFCIVGALTTGCALSGITADYEAGASGIGGVSASGGGSSTEHWSGGAAPVGGTNGGAVASTSDTAIGGTSNTDTSSDAGGSGAGGANTGGLGAAGATSAPGGMSSTGGVLNVGGSALLGGATQGGGSTTTKVTTGGTTSIQGGATSTGGMSTNGGQSNSAGSSATGGSMPAGGASNVGGTTTNSSTGGVTPTGGVTSTGGTSNTGGSSATAGASSTKPTPTAVTAGLFHSCALMSDGTVQCWGNGCGGELGDGVTSNCRAAERPVTKPVQVLNISNATAIAAGGYHTCAIVGAGTVKCWGENIWGQLGNGTETGSFTPVTVRDLSTAKAIAAGTFHTCAALADGTVYCWGSNDDYELGSGTTDVESTTPIPVRTASGPLSSISSVTSASALMRSTHTCALNASGSVFCWGPNASGELGSQTGTKSNVALPVPSIDAAKIAAGADFSCALLKDSTVACWGYNGDGELGNGKTDDSVLPVKVALASEVSALSCGGYHGCATNKTDGSAQCWGQDEYGQLGNANVTSHETKPVNVVDLKSISSIADGTYHACAVAAGAVYCWGYNDFGQVGNGNTGSVSSPVPVIGL